MHGYLLFLMESFSDFRYLKKGKKKKAVIVLCVKEVVIIMNIFFLWIYFAFCVDYPSWITAPSDDCGRGKLCAVGEGKTFVEAASNARAELAKIFLTRVEKKFTLHKSVRTDRPFIEQDMEVFLKENTDQKLKGVEILKQFAKGKMFFALASMDKRKTASLLKSKIDDLDEKIKGLVQSGRYGDLTSSFELIEKRKKIEERYQFLTNRSLPEKITFSQILLEKRKKQAGKTIAIVMIGKDERNELKKNIREILNREGFVVVEKNIYDVLVHVTIESKKEYIQVKGFEKYMFSLAVVIKDRDDKQIDSLDFSMSGIGRNFSHAYGSVILDIKNYMKDNLHKLNLGGNQ